MQIQILSVQVLPATTKTGKPYEVVDLAYKNLTYQGKVEGRKIMPFGNNAPAFAILKSAQAGQVFEVVVEKGATGYNEWTSVTPSDGAVPAQAAAAPKPYQSAAPAASNSRGFATPEERAATQVYIVRQSSITAAVNTLAAGAKSALDPVKVIETAKVYEAHVLGIEQPKPDASGFDNMDSDVPL